MTDEICIPVFAHQFEVPVVGRQPRVDDRGGDATVSENQRAWRLLAAMACVALDLQNKQALFHHAFIIER
jgi:hypothetical protein